MLTPLPPCCGALDEHWPWPEPLPGAQWIALRFDRARFSSDDFLKCEIASPDTIRCAAPKRQMEFLAGRLCAREALHRLTGIAHVPAIAQSKAPAWPADLVGSITHSGDLAAALVAPAQSYRGLGLDAEAMLTTQRGERLAGQILTPSERDWLATLPIDRRGHFVTLAFSLKESLFKALFPLVNVRFYFQDAELIAWNSETQQATLQLLKSLSSDWPAASRLHGQYTLRDGYLISLIAIPA
ncbi:enterobactin synthetase component D [Modicisalibacter muralis]|uniref:Enterobactin synthase component D n=1 Tax=Modicisalibacter muralis TaxID=119000 RepID=A0A1G9ICT2_9GAMM|nr:4'-phosphopantetheinyl transferase superfamily protein [Halomonas muralis]SDL22916.1 enterobactin synthetase component D [Halomonas muralis]